MPTISVIVPVYNVEPWLKENLESIRTQSFTDYECILVDDGSTDGGPALCDKYARNDDRFKVIHKPNGGLSSARNSGIEVAQGRYIAFVDSDDVILKDYLKVLYSAIQKEGADMAICGVEDVNEFCQSLPAPALTLPAKEGTFSGMELIEEFYGESGTYYTVAWNKLYKAELWKTLRYPHGLIHEDDAVAHCVFHACKKVTCVAQPLYLYRMRTGSICRVGLSPARFDGVTALVMRCNYMKEQNFPRELQDKALASCWHRFLSLCSQAKALQDPALLPRWCAEQERMRTLMGGVLGCKELTAAEKFSCLLWGTR
ncbi:MAG: glycosyltransferase, partial [Oscillospiraceae bacterium]|nr:glycosyltransferase [Oscillospiraceae bacterium]